MPSPLSVPLQLPAVTERQALETFVAAVAFMRSRAMPIPTLLELADLQAQNIVGPTPELTTQTA